MARDRAVKGKFVVSYVNKESDKDLAEWLGATPADAGAPAEVFILEHYPGEDGEHVPPPALAGTALSFCGGSQ